MHPSRRDAVSHYSLPLFALWRTHLIPKDRRQNPSSWILLADPLQGHKVIRSAMRPMPEDRQHYQEARAAAHQYPRSGDLRPLGN